MFENLSVKSRIDHETLEKGKPEYPKAGEEADAIIRLPGKVLKFLRVRGGWELWKIVQLPKL